jgi:hypothetical protein
MSALTFLVAAAGTAASIAITHHRAAGGTPTFVATQTTPSTPAATTTAPTTTTKHGKPTKRPKPPVTPNGQLHWPANVSGWTIVLGSFPLPHGRAAAQAAAEHAARIGVPQVGMLDSGKWPSLNPGYDVVFSGIYRTPAEAQSALAQVRHAGFGGAYPRQIAQ